MAISPQQLTIYLYSAHRAVTFAIAQLSCYRTRTLFWKETYTIAPLIKFIASSDQIVVYYKNKPDT